MRFGWLLQISLSLPVLPLWRLNLWPIVDGWPWHTSRTLPDLCHTHTAAPDCMWTAFPSAYVRIWHQSTGVLGCYRDEFRVNVGCASFILLLLPEGNWRWQRGKNESAPLIKTRQYPGTGSGNPPAYGYSRVTFAAGGSTSDFNPWPWQQ